MRTYEKYKDSGISWIGKVPEDWERVRIKYGLSQSIAGVWGDEKKGDENDVVCYRMADFNYDKGILNLDNVTYRNILPQQLVGRMVKKGDLILEKSGGGDLYPVGRVVRVNSDQKATCSNFAHTIATNDNISSNFLYYYFFNLYSKGVSRLFFNQTTGIQNLKVGEYLSQDMYAPSKPEQEAIANYLDKKTAEIDKIIAEREKKIELLNELKSSIISRAVTKGINPHAKMKDSGIDWVGEIPEDWEIMKIKHICKLYNGATPTTSNPQFWNGDIKWVTPVDINEKFILDTGRKITREGYESCGTNMVESNSIIMSTRAPIGKVAINKVPVCTNQGCKSIVCNQINVGYCYYLLSTCTEELNFLGSGTTFLELSFSALANFEIPYPSTSEQQAIANYLDKKTEEIDKTISAIKNECNLYKEYKQSLISEVVTGKRKVID